MFSYKYRVPTVAYCGEEKKVSSKMLKFDVNTEIEELLKNTSF